MSIRKCKYEYNNSIELFIDLEYDIALWLETISRVLDQNKQYTIYNLSLMISHW